MSEEIIKKDEKLRSVPKKGTARYKNYFPFAPYFPATIDGGGPTDNSDAGVTSAEITFTFDGGNPQTRY